MTNPTVTHLIDQQAASIRDLFDSFDVDLGDEDQLYAVKVTAMVMREIAPADFETFIRCLQTLGR